MGLKKFKTFINNFYITKHLHEDVNKDIKSNLNN